MNHPKSILFLLGLLFFINSYAQEGTFSKMFSANSYDEGIAAFRMPNKTYRIIANTGAWGWGSNNIWYIALDSNANFSWHKTMGYGGIDVARAATTDSKGNTYIVGTSTSESGNSYQMLFIAMDSSGTTITKKYFGGQDWDYGNGISLINDTTIILVGETYSYANQHSDAWILKISTSGDIIWSKTVGGDKKDAFYAIAQTPNNDIICVGNSQNYGNGSNDPFLFRCNSQGDSISQIVVQDSTDGCFMDIKVAADSTFYAGGYQRDTNDLYQDYLLRRYTKANQQIWNESTLTQQMEARFNTLAFHGENILAFGKTQKYGSEGDNIFCDLVNRYDGAWIDGFATGSLGDEFAYSVTTDTSNGDIHYLIIGTSTSYDMVHSGVYFIRCNYNLEFEDTVSIDFPSGIKKSKDNSEEINIFFNSISNKIIIENKLQKQHGNIKIYDMLGKCIYQAISNDLSDKSIIDVSSWPRASYTVVFDSKEYTVSKIIVK